MPCDSLARKCSELEQKVPKRRKLPEEESSQKKKAPRRRKLTEEESSQKKKAPRRRKRRKLRGEDSYQEKIAPRKDSSRNFSTALQGLSDQARSELRDYLQLLRSGPRLEAALHSPIGAHRRVPLSNNTACVLFCYW